MLHSAVDAICSQYERHHDSARLLSSLSASVQGSPTPLHIAAAHGHAEVAERLLRSNPWAVTTQDAAGKTALHSACLHGQAQVLQTLLTLKPRRLAVHLLLGCTDGAGRSALSCACVASSAAAVEVLLAAGAEVAGSPGGAGRAANAAWPASTSPPPLHLAALHGNVQLVALLLESGAEVDSVDAQGRTPVACATVEGFTDVVELLL
eukprot:COSAG01_NODE_17085_length_1180_cov_0.983349_1_plen_206_part_10